MGGVTLQHFFGKSVQRVEMAAVPLVAGVLRGADFAKGVASRTALLSRLESQDGDQTIKMKRQRISTTMLAWVAVLLTTQAIAEEKFQKLSGAQIRAKLAGMEMTDEVHWRYVYDRDGTLRTHSMGRRRVGKWSVQKDQLCLDLGDGPDGGCFEVWLSGRNVELRPSGIGLPLEGVIDRPADRN